ncbi:uncharacterized protein LOC123537752 [Mercenaria mercenaria]|uniref:uncharacterized protein LOC123537752 n=1 Tax=Mercenaria mercenaria TaxID=6596 RepID=UPI00234EFF0B|nr:uncharacterized protein LOC123537752 [Mercenaria mercenaria]
MAAGNDFTKSIAEGSEEIFDTCCSPCSESGRTKEADKFCVDCGSYFCAKCLLDHNKFPALRSHQILDKSGQDKQKENYETGVSLPTERCSIHHGKLVDKFCKDHDEVCCAACIAIKHRACVNIDYLTDISKGIKDSAEYKDTKHSLQNILSKMKQEREARNNKLNDLEKQKNKLLEDVDSFKEELIKRIKELAETSKKQIRSKYEGCKNVIQSDLDTLDTVISTTTTSEKKLSSKNEAQLFVNIKTSKVSIKECEALLSDMSKVRTNEELKFTLNQGLKKTLDSLGCVVDAEEDIKEYRATLYGKFKVGPQRCEITGICTMDDGTFVIGDWTHSKLKRLNESFTVEDHIQVDGRPYSVCRTGTNEVATFLDGKNKIQFVSLGQRMELKTAFNIDSSEVGVSYDVLQGSLLICGGNQVSVYTKSGVLLQAYSKEETGDKMFVSAKQLAFNTQNLYMFVTDDSDGKIKALVKDGKTIWTFSDPKLQRPWGVCVLPGDIILASGLASNNVLQIDKDGRKIGELLGASEQLKYPYALAFDRKNSGLLIGSSSNKIHVYTLSRI